MKYEWWVALRFFRSQKSHSFFSNLSILALLILALALMIPTVSVSLLTAFHESIQEKHIQKDYHLQLLITDSSSAEKLKQEIIKNETLNKDIERIVPFYRESALLEYRGSGYLGVLLQGVNGLSKDSSFSEHFPLVVGEHSKQKKFRLILGKALAKLLNPNPKEYQDFIERVQKGEGPIIKLLAWRSQMRSGKRNPKQQQIEQPEKIKQSNTERQLSLYQFQVTGIFDSGYEEYDQYLVFTDLESAQILFQAIQIEQGIQHKKLSGLGIKLKDKDQAEEFLATLSNRYTHLRAYTWKDFHSHLIQAFAWEKTLIRLILVIMILGSVIMTVYINLNILVMDKKKEIGILRSFGVSAKKIERIFVLEGFLIGSIGSFLGLTLSFFFLISLEDGIHWLERGVNSLLFFESAENWQVLSGGFGHLKSFLYRVDFWDFFPLAVLCIFVSLVASFIPAKRSGYIKSLSELLRYE